MKRSRIFMGLSSLVLAIAGIAATKATSKFVTYYYQESAALCTVISPTCGSTSGTCTVLIGTKHYTVFTERVNAGATCQTPAPKI